MKEFKHAPKSIPLLTDEQWKVLEEDMDRPITKDDIRIRKVKVLTGKAKTNAKKMGLSPNDLVIVKGDNIERVIGDPVLYLLKRANM